MVDLRKWSSRVEAGEAGFWELDSTLPVRMIYGLDASGRYSFGYFSDSEPQAQSISNAVHTVTRQRVSDGQWTQIFTLNDPSLKGPFASFCDHMAREIATATSVDLARQSVVDTISRWRRLFSRGFGVLDISALRGLFAELHVGFEYSGRTWSPDRAAGAWTGPYETPHDFDFGGFSLEIKSRSLGKNVVRINGEEQLYGDNLGLAVVEVSQTMSPEPAFETLPRLIERIKASLTQSGVNALNLGLSELGFDVDQDDYRNFYFKAEDIKIYKVIDGFPRITPSIIELGISHVSYDLGIESISNFQVDGFE